MSYLFMTGEPTFVTTLVFSFKNWDVVSTPTALKPSRISDGSLMRSNRPMESIAGVIHYADVFDKSIEENNLKTIINNNIRCWPNPKTLLKMIDRHSVMKECYDFGLVNHEIVQSDKFAYQIEFPFVLKTGTEHRGIGKYLIKSIKDIPVWEGIATMEPFFEGESVRVLKIGQDIFTFKTTNKDSWIKNSPGADIEKCNVPSDMVRHALDAANYFELEIAGVDYILEDDGTFHFLEINQYPALGLFDDTRKCAVSFLKDKMTGIEYDVGFGNSITY